MQSLFDALCGFAKGLHSGFRKGTAALIRHDQHDHPAIVDQ
jgi:hypothetical protein